MNKENKWIKILLLFTTVFCLTSCKSSDYEEAADFLSKGDYDSALELFELLAAEDYKDSAEKVNECNYLKAKSKFEQMDYLSAYDLYRELGNYKDSSDLAKEAGYYLANLYATNDKYADAYSIFVKIRGYKDSDLLAEKCVEYSLINAERGDRVLFGQYEQDGIEDNGKEPITWIVIGTDNGKYYLLSEYLLDRAKFDSSPNIYRWKDCSLREWLNKEFYDQTFSREEKEKIQNVITSDATKDNVFLLSAEEARGFFTNDTSRIAYPTEAQVINGFSTFKSDNAAEWWTRSVSSASNGKGVVNVEDNGEVRSAGVSPDVPNKYLKIDIGVRPAICININGTVKESLNLAVFGYDSNRGLDNEPRKWSSKSSANNGNKCPVCNGTGYVRYYYGASALEAWLAGEPDYTVGPCTSCNGTGKIK